MRPEPLYSAKAARALFVKPGTGDPAISQSVWYSILQRGEIATIRAGKRIWITESALKAWAGKESGDG